MTGRVDLSAIGPFVTEQDANRYLAAGYWSSEETLPALLRRHAERWPTRLAVVDDLGQRVTYAHLHERSDHLAAALRQRAVGRGDVVGVQLPNRVEAALVASAVEKLGAVVCPMVTPYREHELGYIIAKTSMKVLFVPGRFRKFDHDALAATLLTGSPTLQTVVTLSTSVAHPAMITFDQLEREGREAGGLAPVSLDPNSVAAVLFTSGTEADPKGILHTHNTLLANLRALVAMLDLTDRDGVFMASPVGHGTGYGFGVRLACYLGSTLSLLGVWDPERAATLLSEYSAAYTHGSTPFVQDMLNLGDVSRFDLSHLRYFVTGGATVPPGTATRVGEVLGCQLLRLYGQTEGFMSTLSRSADGATVVDRSDGYPVAGVELKVVDEDGNSVPVGEVGECVYRGPHRCVGFLDDPGRVATAMTADGWIRSGDLVSVGADGYLQVVGRKKEVINRGGYKYSPREVEDVLAGHPDVDRVAVVRMDDARLGDRACAFVVARPGRTPTTEDFAQFLQSHGIAAFKWPERIELVPDLPMTASGKVQKYQLEERLRRIDEPARPTRGGPEHQQTSL